VKKAIFAAVVYVLMAAGTFVLAGEKDGFKTTIAVGVTLTDGNSETLQANASLLTEGEKEGLGSVRAGIEANYGEAKTDGNDETTVENGRAFANTRKTLTENTFVSLDGSVLYDDIALIDYRVALGPALGAYLIKNDRTALSLEVGAVYVWEEVDGIDNDYTACRVAERCEHALSETARIWQSVEYIPEAGDAGNYLVNAEAGIEAALNASINLRVVLQDKYDNEPALGLEENDLSLIAGISLSI